MQKGLAYGIATDGLIAAYTLVDNVALKTCNIPAGHYRCFKHFWLRGAFTFGTPKQGRGKREVFREDWTGDAVTGARRFNRVLSETKNVTAAILQTAGAKEYDGIAVAIVR